MFYDQKCFLLIGISVKHDFFLSEAVNDSISCWFQPNPTQNWFWADLASFNSPLKYEFDCHETLESTKTGFLIGSTIAAFIYSDTCDTYTLRKFKLAKSAQNHGVLRQLT